MNPDSGATERERAAQLLKLVSRTPASQVADLLTAGLALRAISDRMTTLPPDGLDHWTGDAQAGFELACKKLGQVDGKHYTEWIPQLNAWRAEKSMAADDQSLHLLEALMCAVEREGQLSRWGLPPNYYERAAIIYRRRQQYVDEIAVCERYAAASPEGWKEALAGRLTAARDLAAGRRRR